MANKKVEITVHAVRIGNKEFVTHTHWKIKRHGEGNLEMDTRRRGCYLSKCVSRNGDSAMNDGIS